MNKQALFQKIVLHCVYIVCINNALLLKSGITVIILLFKIIHKAILQLLYTDFRQKYTYYLCIYNITLNV